MDRAVLFEALIAALRALAAAGPGAAVGEEGAVARDAAVSVVAVARGELDAPLPIVVVEALADNGLGGRRRAGGQRIDEESDPAKNGDHY